MPKKPIMPRPAPQPVTSGALPTPAEPTMISLKGWTLAKVEGDDEPRILDTELAQKLGYARPTNIRILIKRMLAARQLTPCITMMHVGIAGKLVVTYYLTERQALKVTTHADTTVANVILDQILDVYEAFRRGDPALAAAVLDNNPDPEAALEWLNARQEGKQVNRTLNGTIASHGGTQNCHMRVAIDTCWAATGTTPAAFRARRGVTTKNTRDLFNTGQLAAARMNEALMTSSIETHNPKEDKAIMKMSHIISRKVAALVAECGGTVFHTAHKPSIPVKVKPPKLKPQLAMW